MEYNINEQVKPLWYEIQNFNEIVDNKVEILIGKIYLFYRLSKKLNIFHFRKH
jgi:hypothetical protein